MSIHPTPPSSLIGVLGAIGLFHGLSCLPVAGSDKGSRVVSISNPAAKELETQPPAAGTPPAGESPVPPADATTGTPESPAELEQPVIPGVLPKVPARAGDVPADLDLPQVPPGFDQVLPVWPPEAGPSPGLLPAIPTPDPFATGTDSNAVNYATNLNPIWGLSPLGGRPSGFGNVPGGFGGMRAPLLPGFNLSASLAGTYDSNASQGYGSANGSGAKDDFFFTLGGNMTYQTKGTIWTFTAAYSGGYNEYFRESNLSGYFQNAGASLNYDAGGRLTATLNVGVDFGSGANRYYQAVVNQVSYNYAIIARYAIGPKTSVVGSFSQNLTGASGGANQNTGMYDIGVSALWRYSPLTEFGPGIRYTSRTGDSQQNRTSIGPTLTVNHKLTSKFSLNSQVGLDFADSGSGGTTNSTVSASLAAIYQATELWGMNFSLYRDVEADPSGAGGFTEITALRLGYQRKIQRATLDLGIAYETNTFTNSGTASQTRPAQDFLTLDASLGMPVFANTCNASVFMRYRDQNGDPANSWNSFQTGFHISRSF